VLTYLWRRFLFLGWIGKFVAVAVILYGLGWIFGTLGADGAARQLGSAGLYVLAFPLTALAIRQLWRLSRKPGR
jgi:type IV secretory pathway VirB2 component (pilin)